MKWLLAVIVAGGLVALGVTMTIEVPWTLVTGWAPFLARVLPRVTFEPRTVAFGAAVLVLFTAGVHWLGRSAYGRPWRLRWSLIGVATVVVLFAAGICLIGVVHQTGWLLTADEPAMAEVERLRFGRDDTNSADMLKQTVFGLHNMFVNNEDRSPGVTAADGTVLHNWVTPALPYVGFTLEGIDFTKPWDSPENRPFFRAPFYYLTNPSLITAPVQNADGYGLAHYAANCHAMENGAIRPLKDFTDGTANTLLIGEVNANFEPWAKPGNCRDPGRGINSSAYGFGGPLGSGGALFAMADGSVRLIGERISPNVLKALSTPDGGESIDEPW